MMRPTLISATLKTAFTAPCYLSSKHHQSTHTAQYICHRPRYDHYHHQTRRTRTVCDMTMSTAVEIQSMKNPRIKDVRTLLQRRQRDKQNRILLEGQRLIADALQAGIQPLELFCTPEALERSDKVVSLREAVGETGAANFIVSDAVIRSLSDTVTPQGVVAVFEKPTYVLPTEPTLILICDEIRDPGNLGTLLRSAAASGVGAVILSNGCADLWSMKTLRSGMGAQFHLPIECNMQWSAIAEYTQRTGLDMHVATGGGKATSVYSEIDWTEHVAVVIGSEADGASPDAFEAAGNHVMIPMVAGVESLNAAMAGTVLLFEIARQRRIQQGEQKK